VRDASLMYWGMVVTGFILIAGMLTARELLDMYYERRGHGEEDSTEGKPSGRV
jgi:hypothetical protein